MYENAQSDPFWDDFDIPNNAWAMGIPIHIYIYISVCVCVYVCVCILDIVHLMDYDED